MSAVERTPIDITMWPTATVESTWFTDATLQVAPAVGRPPTSRHRSAKWTVAAAEQNGSGPTKFRERSRT